MQFNQEHMGVVVVTLDTKELERGLRADAESLTHDHARYHDVVLPVLVWLDAFLVIFSPSHGLINHLLNAKTLHLIFVHAIEVIFDNFVEH